MTRGNFILLTIGILLSVSITTVVISKKEVINPTNKNLNPTVNALPVEKFGEINKENIVELNAMLSIIRTSIDEVNEQLFKDKVTNDARIKKIEESLSQLSDQDISLKEPVAELPITPLVDESIVRKERAYNQMATFNDALEREDRDESWATGMEETISFATQLEKFNGSSFSSPTCKSTFCKVEVHHEDNESRDTFEFIRREIPNSYHIQHFEEGGELRSVMYLIKQGEEANSVIYDTLNNEAS